MILSLLIAGAVRGTSGAVFSPLSRAPSPTCTLFLFSPPTHRAQARGSRRQEPGGQHSSRGHPAAPLSLPAFHGGKDTRRELWCPDGPPPPTP